MKNDTKPVEPIPLATDRLQLSETSETHLDELVELANDYEVAVRLARMPFPYSRSDGIWYLQNIAPACASWSVLASGRFIGIMSLKPEPELDFLGLGYWLGRSYWGQGYATEAGRAIVQYCASLSNLSHLRSGHYAENRASGRVLEKLGFRKVGQHKRDHPLLGKKVEHVDMLLKIGSPG
ncbi:MAG: GNAT family N-acetyltransferase [Pseudomonadota bacterium]